MEATVENPSQKSAACREIRINSQGRPSEIQ
jgi:hypothetical protein